MTDEQLAEIEARAAAATAGSWEWRPTMSTDPRVGPPYFDHWRLGGNGRVLAADRGTIADAEFIAHARTDVEALVAEVERLLAREASVLPLLIEVMAWLVNDQVRGPFNASREALIQRLSAALDGDFARLDEAQAEREEAIDQFVGKAGGAERL